MSLLKKIPKFLAMFCCIGIVVSFVMGSGDMLFYCVGCIIFAVLALIIKAKDKQKQSVIYRYRNLTKTVKGYRAIQALFLSKIDKIKPIGLGEIAENMKCAQKRCKKGVAKLS